MTTRVEIVNDFLAVNAKVGTSLQDIAEAAGSGIPFGCRDGECGTCLIDVVTGGEFLNPMTDKEKKVISNLCCTKAETRLACQMKVEKPNGLVRLKY